MDDKLYLRQGSSQDGAFSLVVTPEQAGWTYSGLKVLTLPAGGTHTWPTGDDEILVLPLAGSAVVTCEGQTFALQGRRSVFSRVSDFSYAPRDAEVTVASKDGGVFAIPSARCASRLEPRYGPAEDVPVELRGAGQASRQVNNFCSPGAFECDKLIAVEVLTPGGNWSSYPPHKHDETREDEAELEEIYYFDTPGLGLPAGVRHARPPHRRAGRGRAPATWCSSRTAGTARRSPPPATTCTTSTSWRARRRCAPGASATTRPTPGSAAPGRTRQIDPRLPMTLGQRERKER